MSNALLAARLGVTKLAPKTSAPVASPVMDAGDHKPAPDAAEGGKGLDQHHAKMTAAHKAGDHASARGHALNYANASSKLGKSATQPPHGGHGAGGITPPAGTGAKPPKGMLRDVLTKKGF